MTAKSTFKFTKFLSAHSSRATKAGYSLEIITALKAPNNTTHKTVNHTHILITNNVNNLLPPSLYAAL